MGRTLRHLGLVILAGTACLLLASLADWIPVATSDFWVSRGAVVGLACLGAGMLLRLLAPLGRELARAHCSQCGAPTERGQRFCRDHLKAALDEARDKTRESVLARGGPRGSAF
jgi:hypothetical protein